MLLASSHVRLKVNSLSCRIVDNVVATTIARIKTSYKIEGSEHISSEWNGIGYIVGKDGIFPTGYLKEVIQAIEDEGGIVDIQNSSDRIDLELFDGFEHPLRDYQLEAVTLPLIQSPIQMGIIKAATNAGKSYPIASISISAVKADLPVLIMVHNELIFNQLYDELTKYIEVGRINSKIIDLKTCTIAMEKSIANSLKKHSEIELYLKMVKVVIVDECHRVGSNDYQLILNKLAEVSVKIGFSGTPLDGSLKNNIKVKSVFGEVLLDVTNKEMMDRGISSQVTVKIHQIPYMVTKASYKEAKRLVLNNRTRIAIMKELVLKALKETLIVVEEFGHAEALQKALYPFNVPILHGKMPIKKRKELLEEFYDGKYNALISTSVIQEGVNARNIRSLIYASGYMSEIKLKQYIGRALRKKEQDDVVYIYDFYDHIEHFNTHADERIRIYNQEQFKIIE